MQEDVYVEVGGDKKHQVAVVVIEEMGRLGCCRPWSQNAMIFGRDPPLGASVGEGREREGERARCPSRSWARYKHRQPREETSATSSRRRATTFGLFFASAAASCSWETIQFVSLTLWVWSSR